jgi:hypothetical protein
MYGRFIFDFRSYPAASRALHRPTPGGSRRALRNAGSGAAATLALPPPVVSVCFYCLAIPWVSLWQVVIRGCPCGRYLLVRACKVVSLTVQLEPKSLFALALILVPLRFILMLQVANLSSSRFVSARRFLGLGCSLGVRSSSGTDHGVLGCR